MSIPPGELVVPDLPGLDRAIKGVAMTVAFQGVKARFVDTQKDKQQHDLTCRYIGEKLIEHLLKAPLGGQR